MKAHVVYSIKLEEQHQQTDRTRHFIDGSLMGKPYALQIMQFSGDRGYYLLYLDEFGKEITDTYHDKLDDAFAQAEWEFCVKPNEWQLNNDDN